MAYDDNYDDPGQKQLATNAAILIYNQLVYKIPNTQTPVCGCNFDALKPIYDSMDEIFNCHDIVHGINAFLIEAARNKYNDEFVFNVIPNLVEGEIDIKHVGFIDDDHEFGEYREISYGYDKCTSEIVPINMFDVHFDVRDGRYHISDELRVALENWLFCKMKLPGNKFATSLMSRDFKILTGGKAVDGSPKG